mmetsp:Transcript_1382/g.3905  ORF Transcript_1382/g.3905 Transcript_1382/m.3905 type:complete len:220 (-) Transcript_1382:673-1332(-)
MLVIYKTCEKAHDTLLSFFLILLDGVEVNRCHDDHNDDDQEVGSGDDGSPHGVNLLGFALKGEQDGDLLDAPVLVRVVHVLVLYPQEGPLTPPQDLDGSRDGFGGFVAQARNDTVRGDGECPANPADEVGDARKDVKPLVAGQTDVLPQPFPRDEAPVTGHVPNVAVQSGDDQHREPHHFPRAPVSVQLHVIPNGRDANGTQRSEVLATVDKLPLVLRV